MSPVKSLAPCLLTLLFLYVEGIQGESTVQTHGKVVACYVASWARYRPTGGQFLMNDLKPEYCTHLIYAFAGLNSTSWEIRSLDNWADLEEGGIGNYRKMTALRDKYPGLKISLAIGGWNEGSGNYSALVSDMNRRRTFINSVVNFLKKYKFDGLDLDWEFPGQRGGNPEDKKNFALLVKELQSDFSIHHFILTAAISANKKIISEAYDIPKISKYLDYVHLMAYDYHGAWDLKVLPNAPLNSNDDANINSSVSYLLKLGVPPEKLVLGLPMYGRTFILVNDVPPEDSPIGMTAQSKSFSGPYTREDGIMGYNEICKELADKSWISKWDTVSSTPYAVNGLRVISYDDYSSLEKKVLYATELNLAGVMIWSIDTDDFKGSCGTDYTLMKSINNAFVKNVVSSTEQSNDGTNSAHALYNAATVVSVIFSILILITF
ncbi:hypothetical protein KPH14_003365 [Odynerus spinipes]|uniref:GH18 domain-containing protein n=1 Tax=Odynerus spinipes TaxID=1348599 RepID=A0AAD9VKN2_9HYME|nr:hypothetical protein KPH14_003365 [Odynerus spinipes]